MVKGGSKSCAGRMAEWRDLMVSVEDISSRSVVHLGVHLRARSLDRAGRRRRRPI